MELGSAARLLQSRVLGRLVESVPTASTVVPAASHPMEKPARLRRQLGISSTQLSSSTAYSSSGRTSSTMGTGQSPWTSDTTRQAATETDATEPSIAARHTEAYADEAYTADKSGYTKADTSESTYDAGYAKTDSANAPD